MPWKGEVDPYLIWLSEIILQQTRTEQGLPYFIKFKSRYPTVKHLANAKEDEVMKLWQGLGYYSRARNLHYTAKYIASELNGIFPENFEKLKKLKGVGDYTAAAIASFAFGEPKAVVDGNVIRVLSRFFGIETAFDSSAGKKEFSRLAQKLIDSKNPAAYNQAIMDFGASVCKPKLPVCPKCPFQKACVSYQHDLISQLPHREKKQIIKDRFFNFLFITSRHRLLIQKRTEKDIWENLYQLPMIETAKRLTGVKLVRHIEEKLGIKNLNSISISQEKQQLLSHRKIHGRFLEIKSPSNELLTKLDGITVPFNELEQYGFPKMIHLYLQQKQLL